MRVANTTPVSPGNYARSRIAEMLGKIDNLDAEDQKTNYLPSQPKSLGKAT